VYIIRHKSYTIYTNFVSVCWLHVKIPGIQLGVNVPTECKFPWMFMITDTSRLGYVREFFGIDLLRLVYK
jgi:hypothetical protein